MHIALLGRQPELSIAELERLFTDVSWFSDQSALINITEPIDVQRLGGTQKLGRVILTLPAQDWRQTSRQLVQHYQSIWRGQAAKLTVGISAYGFHVDGRDVQKTGLILKTKLKPSGTSLRLIPNQEAALSTATAHHNKLGLTSHKLELLVFRGPHQVIIAESIGTQNITALAARDQGRPRRDAFVGMLPPKLALIMLNLAGSLPRQPAARILDPFCGTGVLLQEALLLGYDAYGTDLSAKMIQFSQDNLTWLKDTAHPPGKWQLAEADATDFIWQPPVSAVVTETYLGQPFSAPPSSNKLTEVRANCQHIIGQFLKNISGQLAVGTPLVLAVPAWRDNNDTWTHLPLTADIESYGFQRVNFKTIDSTRLLYNRPNQVVGRELLILTKV